MEYAQKAVENSSTAIGLRGKDGVVIAVEKLVLSKLYDPGANKRIFHVDTHIGLVSLCQAINFNGYSYGLIVSNLERWNQVLAYPI